MLAFLLAMILTAGVGAFADPLLNATKQRIGNYDFEMTTQPRSPEAGKPAKIMLRFAGVNGDDLVDVPIALRLVKDGNEVYWTNPVVVPYGHHSLEYTFPEPGRYALYVNLKDYAYSGETLTFTFLINASGPVDYITSTLPIFGAIAAAAIAAVVVVKKKKKLAM